MGHNNKRYAEEFKREALEMAAKGDVSIAQIERDLGITPGLIYKWRERYLLTMRVVS